MSATLKQQMSSRMTNNEIRISTVFASLCLAWYHSPEGCTGHQRKQHTQGYMKKNLRCVTQSAAQTQHCVRVLSVCPNGSSHVCCLLSETVALSVIICPVPPCNFQKSSSTTQSPCTPRTGHWNLTRTPVTSITAQSAPLMSGILTGQMRFCIKGNVS